MMSATAAIAIPVQRPATTGASTTTIPPLARLLSELAASNYSFITPTPLTHRRVLMQRESPSKDQPGRSLRDVFGWNLPFHADAVRPGLLAVMDEAGVLQAQDGLLSSAVRVATLNHDLFIHSGYPTEQNQAVFFGPDTYRFARFIQQSLRRERGPASGGRALRLLDVGCGSGAGGMVAARCLRQAHPTLQLCMNDINPLALQYTAINAAFAGIAVELAPGDALSAVTGMFDLITCNPPYLDDAAGRAYRHGGLRLGRALGVRIAKEALARLAPAGELLLYTGVAIVEGVDPFIAELLPFLDASGYHWSYSEIDPDVFGEELERPVYKNVDRIAAVGLRVQRSPEAA